MVVYSVDTQLHVLSRMRSVRNARSVVSYKVGRSANLICLHTLPSKQPMEIT